MRTNKMKMSKIKIAVVIGLLCCMAMDMSVMAFNEYYQYTVGPNETKTIASFVPGTSTIHISIRPSVGEDVIIIIGGTSIDTSRPDWVVTGFNPNATLTITVKAGSRGASGILHIWR